VRCKEVIDILIRSDAWIKAFVPDDDVQVDFLHPETQDKFIKRQKEVQGMKPLDVKVRAAETEDTVKPPDENVQAEPSPELCTIIQPEIGLPEIGLPNLPEIGLPNLPEIGLPGIEIPKIGLPEIGLPNLPEIGLPDAESPPEPSATQPEQRPDFSEFAGLQGLIDHLGLPAKPTKFIKLVIVGCNNVARDHMSAITRFNAWYDVFRVVGLCDKHEDQLADVRAMLPPKAEVVTKGSLQALLEQDIEFQAAVHSMESTNSIDPKLLAEKRYLFDHQCSLALIMELLYRFGRS
jgi:hypothetical protein